MMVMGGLERETQVVVIGAGPGGYAAAFRAADLGREVTLIDAAPALGGECLHHGCIPSKALLTATHLREQISAAQTMGIRVEGVSVDANVMRQWKDGILGQLAKGLEQLAARRDIEIIYGHAAFTGSRRLRISDGGAGTLTFEQAINQKIRWFQRCAAYSGLTVNAQPKFDFHFAKREARATLVIVEQR